jgi:cell division septation protein DedD
MKQTRIASATLMLALLGPLLSSIASAQSRTVAGWAPRATEPSAAARRVLDSLPDPRRVPVPEEIRRASAAGGPTVLPPAPATRDSTPPPSGACLEVQLAATADEGRATMWATEAAAALVTETRIVPGGGLFRVRAGGCLDRAAADALSARARAAGWTGAFVTPAR